MVHPIICIQARLGSTRFPEKIVQPFVQGHSLLTYQVARLRRITGYPVVVLTVPADQEKISQHLLGAFTRTPVDVYSFSLKDNDVLGRFAALPWVLPCQDDTLLVRVCGDCPLIDPWLLKDLVTCWQSYATLDYLGMGPGWPDGLADYDLFTVMAILRAHAQTNSASDREHVSPAFWRHPARFAMHTTAPPPAWVRAHSWPQFSVDTPDDFRYVQRVATQLHTQFGDDWTWQYPLLAIQASPELSRAPAPMNPAYVAQVHQEGAHGHTWEEIRYGLDP